jgi:predicted transcriptional regulator
MEDNMADKENKTEEDEVMEYDDLVKFINKSSYRVNVLKDLSDGDVKMPRDIAVDCNILPNHISNVLTQLSELDLLECINPEYRKGRLYRLTDDGKNIIKDLK